MEENLVKDSRRYAKTFGCISYKAKFIGCRGGNDVFFFPLNRPILMVEFKNPNKKGRVHPLQRNMHAGLLANGHKVHVTDNFTDFKEVFDAHIRKS